MSRNWSSLSTLLIIALRGDSNLLQSQWIFYSVSPRDHLQAKASLSLSGEEQITTLLDLGAFLPTAKKLKVQCEFSIHSSYLKPILAGFYQINNRYILGPFFQFWVYFGSILVSAQMNIWIRARELIVAVGPFKIQLLVVDDEMVYQFQLSFLLIPCRLFNFSQVSWTRKQFLRHWAFELPRVMWSAEKSLGSAAAYAKSGITFQLDFSLARLWCWHFMHANCRPPNYLISTIRGKSK